MKDTMEHKKYNDSEMTDELLFKYFRCKTDAEEEKMIGQWYEADEENKKRFKDTHDFYEAYLLNASIGMIEGHPSAPASFTRRRKAVRTAAIAVANMAAAIAIFFLSTDIARDSFRKEASLTLTSIEVPAGQRMDITLSDGTVVKLNSGAVLAYPNMFAGNTREVHLEGEAYFDVMHNAGQPFIVKTFASDIEVLGTEFNINADKEAGRFSATLVEGSVRLTDNLHPGKEIIMEPNQTVRLTENSLSVEKCSAKSAVRWTQGILDIDTQDFRELMKKLEMAFGVQIVIDRETMPELTYINGKLRISEGIASALTALQEVADFTYTKDYRTNIIYIR